MSETREPAEQTPIDDALLQFVDDLSAEVGRNELTGIHVKTDGLSIKIENRTQVLLPGLVGPPPPFPAVPGAMPPPPPPPSPPPAEKDAGKYEDVLSPITGIFYAASAPNEPPFAKEGDTVKVGAVLCIVEAMKVMNRIDSKHNGTVHSVEVKNGDVVSTGQCLMRIVPAS